MSEMAIYQQLPAKERCTDLRLVGNLHCGNKKPSRRARRPPRGGECI